MFRFVIGLNGLNVKMIFNGITTLTEKHKQVLSNSAKFSDSKKMQSNEWNDARGFYASC